MSDTTSLDHCAGSDEGFWKANKVATELNVSPKTLANDRVTGRLGIPFYKFGAAVRYSPPEVRAWAQAQRRESTSDPGQGAA